MAAMLGDKSGSVAFRRQHKGGSHRGIYQRGVRPIWPTRQKWTGVVSTL